MGSIISSDRCLKCHAPMKHNKSCRTHSLTHYSTICVDCGVDTAANNSNCYHYCPDNGCCPRTCKYRTLPINLWSHSPERVRTNSNKSIMDALL